MENEKVLDIEVSFYLAYELDLFKFLKRKYNIKFKTQYKIIRKSIDSRKSLRVFYRVMLNVDESFALKLISDKKALAYTKKSGIDVVKKKRIESFMIIGAGPSGLMAGLILSNAGYHVSIVEQGKDVDSRTEDVEKFFSKREFDQYSNIQFGEGGAGTFSDGKIITRVKNPLKNWIYKKLVEFGAPEEIEYLSHPHIGTDRLKNIVKNMRRELIENNVEILFNTKLTGFDIKNKKCRGVVLRNVSTSEMFNIKIENIILAIGNGARDLYRLLEKNNVFVDLKPLAVGYRIIHKQSVIDENQYRTSYKKYKLPASEYFLTYKKGNDNAFSFCMCPGGVVVNGASKKGTSLTNGMSYYARDGKFANSAVLTSLDPKQYFKTVNGFLDYLDSVEQRAFQMGGNDYSLPAMFLKKYLNVGQKKNNEEQFEEAVLPSFKLANIDELYNKIPVIDKKIRSGLYSWKNKIKNWINDDVLLVGPETRSSSPVKIQRDETFRLLGFDNLYVIGEGSGYAGGITSSMIDGAKLALSFV